MPITHSCSVYNFLSELATVLETLIYYLQRLYLLANGEVQKLWSYSHFTGSGNGTGSGDRALYRVRYQYRIVLVVPVPGRNSVPVGS